MKIKKKFRELVGENAYSFLSDKKRQVALSLFPKQVLMNQFENNFGYRFGLDNPQTYNEKLMWLKLYWRDPIATKCADKYAVRDYVREKLGTDEYLNDIYGVYDDIDKIDFNSLPDEFVLKVTHGSGQNIICRNKDTLNWHETIQKLNSWMKNNAYNYSYEWIYKDIQPRIICEKLINTIDYQPPNDYKIFCFNGEPKLLFVATDRENNNTKFDYYTCNWEPLPITNHYPRSGKVLQKPKKLNEMLEVASKLSKDFPHARIDFYYENDEIIFGEITFFHFGGLENFEPKEYDELIGSWLELPRSK